MSPAKQISPNVSQLMSLIYSKSLLWLPFSLIETTGAPLKACETLHTPSYFADHSPTLSTFFLLQTHCCCALSTPKYSCPSDLFYFPFFECSSPNVHAAWPFVWLKVQIKYYFIKEPVHSWPLQEKTLSFSVFSSCFIFLYDLITNASIHFLMVCCFCLECELN